MRRTRDTHRPAPLTTALAVSVALHALAGLAVVAAPSGSSTPDLDPPRPDEQPKADPLELGILESNAVTIDWLGMADPTPHAAELSTTNQAQLSPNPAPETQPQTAAPPPTPEPTPPTPPTDPTPPTEQQPEATPEPDPTPPLPAPEAPDAPSQPAEPKPTSQRTPPVPPTPPSPTPDSPSEADAPAPSPDGAPGLQDPREADAASKEPPPEVRSNGAPIAREGILIQTARPRWSVSTRILAAVRNPTVEVTFGPDGRVRRVDFAKDDEGRALTAGDSRVSQPLLDAIYRWRAEGPKINALTPGTDTTPETTHTITLTIILRD